MLTLKKFNLSKKEEDQDLKKSLKPSVANTKIGIEEFDWGSVRLATFGFIILIAAMSSVFFLSKNNRYRSITPIKTKPDSLDKTERRSKKIMRTFLLFVKREFLIRKNANIPKNKNIGSSSEEI